MLKPIQGADRADIIFDIRELRLNRDLIHERRSIRDTHDGESIFLHVITLRKLTNNGLNKGPIIRLGPLRDNVPALLIALGENGNEPAGNLAVAIENHSLQPLCITTIPMKKNNDGKSLFVFALRNIHPVGPGVVFFLQPILLNHKTITGVICLKSLFLRLFVFILLVSFPRQDLF